MNKRKLVTAVMYSFDGKYRTTPVVSLGGKSARLTKQDLLEKSHNSRLKREQLRLENHSSKKLQSAIRSYLVRQDVKNKLRNQFDECKKIERTNSDDILKLVKWIVYFFDKSSQKDNSRFVWLGKLLVKHKGVLAQHDYNSLYLTSSILRMCCQCLQFTPEHYQVPLRIFEIFLSIDFNTNSKQLWSKVTSNGYFKSIICCLHTNVPNDIPRVTPGTTKIVAPTYLAESLLNLILNPLIFTQQLNEHDPCKSVVIAKFGQEVLSIASPQIFHFVLPSIAYNADIKVADILNVILENLSHHPQDEYKLEPSLSLFAGIIKLVRNEIGEMTPDHFVMLVGCLRMLIGEIPTSMSPDYDEGYSDDEDEPMETVLFTNFNTKISHGISSAELVNDCQELLNGKNFVDACIKHEVYFSSENLDSICSVVYHLLVKMRISVHKSRLLYTLGFSKRFLHNLWKQIIQSSTKSRLTGSQIPVLQLLLNSTKVLPKETDTLIKQLITFCPLYLHNLLSLYDVDFCNTSSENRFMAFNMNELAAIAVILRDVTLSLIKRILPETNIRLRPYHIKDGLESLSTGKYLHTTTTAKSSSDDIDVNDAIYLFRVLLASVHVLYFIGLHFQEKSCSRLVKHIHSRNIRKPFMDDKTWYSNEIVVMHNQSGSIANRWQTPNVHSSVADHLANVSDESAMLSTSEAQQIALLTNIPFVISFETRVNIFKTMVRRDNKTFQNPEAFLRDPEDFNPDAVNRPRKIDIVVRRDFLYEDSFNDLSQNNAPEMRLPLRVEFINSAGMEELGYGRGVTREFLQQVIKQGFDPNRGFFKTTEAGRLYPNPLAKAITENYQDHFYFLGRMLGKVIYEGMQVELPFAAFFLCKLLRKKNADIDINHLQSLDPQFYKNLMNLHNYKGDVSELDLSFTTVTEIFGETKEIELIPNGKNIVVDNNNIVLYMHNVANYKLNVEMREACVAFRRGLSSIIQPEWLEMFDHAEFQTLISGAEVPIDVKDLKKHATYSGGYDASHPVITAFWEIVTTFTDEQLRNLLQFVTSCSRPPLSGFKELDPPFCIHNGGTEDRLPSASTCVHMLKLPAFTDAEVLRERLEQSISSSEGFELS